MTTLTKEETDEVLTALQRAYNSIDVSLIRTTLKAEQHWIGVSVALQEAIKIVVAAKHRGGQ